jgi:hypothetical protein
MFVKAFEVPATSTCHSDKPTINSTSHLINSQALLAITRQPPLLSFLTLSPCLIGDVFLYAASLKYTSKVPDIVMIASNPQRFLRHAGRRLRLTTHDYSSST